MQQPSKSQKPINKVTTKDIESFEQNPSIDHYQYLVSRSAIYPGQGTALGLIYCALKLNGEAGEFAEHVGKALRDDNLMEVKEDWIHEDVCKRSVQLNSQLTPERRELLIKEAGDVFWYVVNICRGLGITPSEVCRRNLVKLADRTERNKLQGSGDER